MTNSYEYQPLINDEVSNGPPPDKYGLAWFCFLILGVGLLFPFNCYIAATDFFSQLYPTVQYSFLMSLAYNYFQWILLFVSLKLMPKFSFKSRIFLFLILSSAILFWVPFINMVFGKFYNAALVISLLCTFLSGCLSSLLFGSVLGLVALFPLDYTGSVMSGCGVAGVIASVLRIITKVSMPADALQKSCFLYFFLAGGLLMICLGCFIILLQLPITKYYLANYELSKLTSKSSINSSNSKGPSISLKALLKKVWREALVVFTVFFTTLSLFPGITGSIANMGGGGLSNDWFPIVFVLTFMIGDLIGRTAPKWFILFTPSNLWIPTFARLAFYPLFALCIKPLVFRSDAWYFIFMFLFSLSNGYCGTLAMMFGPTKAEEHEKETVGIVMSFFLNFGIWVSTHFAFLLLYLITGDAGLPWNTSIESIQEFFNPLIIVPGGIHFLYNSGGKQTGEAYVDFQTEEMSIRSLEKHKNMLGHRYIEVHQRPRSHLTLFKNQQQQQQQHHHHNQQNSNNNNHYQPQQYIQHQQQQPNHFNQNNNEFEDNRNNNNNNNKQKQQQQQQQQQNEYTVKLRGLPFSATQQDIQQFFNGLSSIGVIKIIYNGDRATGTAFVSFSNSNDYQSALSRNRNHIGSRYIEVFPMV
eukprot:gene4757-5936_t